MYLKFVELFNKVFGEGVVNSEEEFKNKIREAFGFKGTSLRFIIRERKEKDQ